MKEPIDLYFEKLLFRLASICRDDGLTNYDQVVVSIGLVLLVLHQNKYERGRENIKNLVYGESNKFEEIKRLIQKKSEEGIYYEDVSNQLIHSISRVTEDKLEELINTINKIDPQWLNQTTSIRLIKLFISRSLMGQSSYFTSNFQLGELLNEIVDVFPNSRVYDPAGGLGIMLSFLNLENASEIILQDINSSIIVIAKLLWQFLDINEKTEFIVENSLFLPYAKEDTVDILIGELPFSRISIKDRSALDNFYWTPSNDTTELFIQLSVSRLSQNGKAFLLIPDGFLFNRSRSSISVKEHLIRHDLIDSIISFPQGFLKPYSNVKSSLLILSKRKTRIKRDCVIFIDAQEDEENYVRYHPSKIQVSLIADIYNSNRIQSNQSILIKNSEIIDNEYDLQAKRYLSAKQLNLQSSLSSHESFIKLKELIIPIKSKRNELDDIPYIKVGDLTNDTSEIKLSFKNWQVVDENKKGRIIKESALLVARVGEKLKPSFFHFDDQAIAINPNIFAYKINADKVDKDYLLFELSEDYFKDQLRTITSGTAQTSWSKKDFSHLKIRIPYYNNIKSLDSQRQHAEQKKEAIIEDKKLEIEALRKQLQVEDKGLEIISNFKHDFMGNLERVSSGIIGLRNFLKDKHESQEVINLSETIIELPKYDGKVDEISLQTWLDRLESNIKSSINTLEYEIEQIKEDREKYEFEVENLYHLLKKLKKKYSSYTQFQIRIEKGLGVEEVKDIKASIDKNKFETIIDNLIVNAINHGFKEKVKKQFQIVFEVDFINENETNFILIKYKNDGRPFPEEFTFEDFIQRGKKAGENAKTGIGGDRINRIIKRHNGIFRSLEPDKTSIYNINFEILIPQNLDNLD